MLSAKAHVLPARDPIAGGPLVITEVEAVESGVTIRGRFEVPRFARLSPDQARFLETFLRCRGMLNSVERELGISYPTARGRLDAVLKALDLHAVREEPTRAQERPLPVETPAEPYFGFEADPETPAEAFVEEPVEDEVSPEAESLEGEALWEAFDEESADAVETAPDEKTVDEAADEKPRRSRDELLSLLERGEISVDELKRELEGTR